MVSVWRAITAAGAASMLIGQLLLSGLLIGHFAWSAAQADASVICAYDQAGLADGSDGAPAPKAHDACPACACPHSAQPLLAAPVKVDIAVLRPRSEALRGRPNILVAGLAFRSPYASRAPPHFA
jgi:hypothetical protein